MNAGEHEGLRQRVKLRATARELWEALTDPEQRPRWCGRRSEVTPGAGGEILDVLPDGGEQRARVEEWSEEAMLRLVRPRGAGPQPRSIEERWRFEVRGGAVHLHLDQEGFGMDPEGRALAAATARSTEFQLRRLRHALERHPGTPRRLHTLVGRCAGGAEAAWARLFGPEGLAGPDSWVPERLGDRYTLHAAGGLGLEGCLQIHTPPHDFAGTVQELDDGFLCLRIEDGEPARLTLELSTFGMDEGRLGEVVGRIEALLEGLGLEPRRL